MLMQITYAKRAKKAIERLEYSVKQRIKHGICNLPNGDIKRLKGYTNLYRLRVGDWRILFTMTAYEVAIEDVRPRGDAYK